jgi:hypothetical protein
MIRAMCVCKRMIRINADRRFLLHYMFAPGLGLTCPGTGKTFVEARESW